MNYNELYQPPAWYKRLLSVWYRHYRVYTSDFLSNAFPPFVEPLIYLAGLGIGMGTAMSTGGMDYTLFLGSGLIVTSAMFTAVFECTYGTFIRLEFDKVYDGMLGATLSPDDLIAGEIFFVGTKGFFFSFAVMAVIWAAGIITYPLSILTVFVGFLTGIMFGALAMFATSKIRNINHFNFFFSGLVTPMFFFSGVMFPLENLPESLRLIVELVPLTHVVRLARALCIPGMLGPHLLWDLAYCILFIGLFGVLASKGMKRRLIG